MPGIGVVSFRCWFVGPTKSDEVGNDDPAAGLSQTGDHLAIQVAPRRLAVQQKHWSAFLGTDLHICHPQGIVDPSGGYRHITWFVGPVGEIGKSLVRGAYYLHNYFLSTPRLLPTARQSSLGVCSRTNGSTASRMGSRVGANTSVEF